MKRKIVNKILALVLCAVIMASGSLSVFAYSDITDPEVAQNAALLSMLGVLSGYTDGSFRGGNNLTRAEFCKMAITAMGNTGADSLYANLTIFPDVKSAHWAAPYVNYAAREAKIIGGYADGYFRPDNTINFGEAVTILARQLQYTDKDVGAVWPAGYLQKAASIGLTDGLQTITGTAAITRAQAAKLFTNMLSCEMKDGGRYISTISSSLVDGVVIMAVDATAEDGTGNAVKTAQGVYKTAKGTAAPRELIGKKGSLALDEAGRVLTFIPDKTGNMKSFTASSAEANSILSDGGQKYEILGTDTVYFDGEQKTFSDVWINIRSGMQVTIYYNSAGKVDFVYISTFYASDNVMVAGRISGNANPFANILGGTTGYKILKNGLDAAISDIKEHDVGIYDTAARVLTVVDYRVTGVYDYARPNARTPEVITMMGTEFTVLPCALPSLSKFKIGDSVTLLLTPDYRVAGAVSGSALMAEQIGIYRALKSGDTDTGENMSATVTLLNGLSITAEPSKSYSEYVGRLVHVHSQAKGVISISPVKTSGGYGEFDIVNLRLGQYEVAPSCIVIDQIDGGVNPAVTMHVGDLTQSKIPASKVVYAKFDIKGRAEAIITQDATGDCYFFGLLKYDPEGAEIDTVREEIGEDGKTIYIPDKEYVPTVAVERKSGTTQAFRTQNNYARSSGYYAVTGAVRDVEDYQIYELNTIKPLTALRVSRSDFTTDNKYIETQNIKIPVWSNAEVFNKVSGTYTDLDSARRFSEELTVYYDRPPEDGGKIRIIIAE